MTGEVRDSSSLIDRVAEHDEFPRVLLQHARPIVVEGMAFAEPPPEDQLVLQGDITQAEANAKHNKTKVSVEWRTIWTTDMHAVETKLKNDPIVTSVSFVSEAEAVNRYRKTVPPLVAKTTQVGDLQVTEDAWISLLIRDGRLVRVRSDTILRAGDEAVVLSTDPDAAGLTALFAAPARD